MDTCNSHDLAKRALQNEYAIDIHKYIKTIEVDDNTALEGLSQIIFKTDNANNVLTSSYHLVQIALHEIIGITPVKYASTWALYQHDSYHKKLNIKNYNSEVFGRMRRYKKYYENTLRDDYHPNSDMELEIMNDELFLTEYSKRLIGAGNILRYILNYLYYTDTKKYTEIIQHLIEIFNRCSGEQKTCVMLYNFILQFLIH